MFQRINERKLQALLVTFVLCVAITYAQETIIYVPVEMEDDKNGGGGNPLDAIFDLKIKKLMMLKEKLG